MQMFAYSIDMIDATTNISDSRAIRGQARNHITESMRMKW